jgi:hypothetical protein
MLRKIFRLERDELTGGLRKPQNEELHNLHSSPKGPVIRMIKSRSMRWTGHAARMG